MVLTCAARVATTLITTILVIVSAGVVVLLQVEEAGQVLKEPLRVERATLAVDEAGGLHRLAPGPQDIEA